MASCLRVDRTCRQTPFLIAALAASGCLATAQTPSQAISPSPSRNSMPELESHVFVSPEQGLSLPYRLFVPAECSAQSPCGLLLFLHGAGERGEDNQAQLGNDALAFTSVAVQADCPTIVVYPQCPDGMQWVDTPWAEGAYEIDKTPISKPMAATLALLAKLETDYPVDAGRLLVTGLSMGGYGTWDLILRRPAMFAGALALCGGGDPTQAVVIRDLPIWDFHGDRDPAVPVRGSRLMIRALRKAGGNPRYTEVAGHGHDVWTVAYRDSKVVRWLLAQRREPGRRTP
jgi:predicted peptidase